MVHLVDHKIPKQTLHVRPERALLHGSSKKNWKLLTEIIIKQVFNHQYASQNEGQ